MTDKIMYVCEGCAEGCPECCGHYDPSDLRVMADGKWLCNECYDNDTPDDAPAWSTLPQPPVYGPVSA